MKNIRFFRDDIQDPSHFVVTLELVPGAESRGRALDTVMQIAADAYADGRVSAVSMTDNPGGNPSLSPDVLSHEIFKLGMDVIVHFTCRDMNRVGMESRALQLALMGIKNILALTGDYSGKGFGGQGAPVFDLDSVSLTCMLSMLSERIVASGDPEAFVTGCAVSPFKYTAGESGAQYAKLCKKVASGAQFAITQLGYDIRKFDELIRFQRQMQMTIPTLASLYLLTPKAAGIMHAGKVPGAVVSRLLRAQVEREWQDPDMGRRLAVERLAQLAAILKAIGYRGIHIGGIHKSFAPVAANHERMAAIEAQWREFVPNFIPPHTDGYYLYLPDPATGLATARVQPFSVNISRWERWKFGVLQNLHDIAFNFDAPLASLWRRLCGWLDQRGLGATFMRLVEDPIKKLLLSCQRCGDCGIQHVAFQCPESQCPKHIRNGACGGSRNGLCEVHPDCQCVWFKAYNRWASVGQTQKLTTGCVPPRMWELNATSAWLNFHLRRDHQSVSTAISNFCRAVSCRLPTSQTPVD